MAKRKILNEISSIVYSLAWFVARDEGYFDAEGLEVEFVKAKAGDPKSGSEDPKSVNPIVGHLPFQDGTVPLFRACEEGNVRRAYDLGNKTINGCAVHITSLQPSRPLHAVVTAPDSGIDHPAQLADKGVAVNFYAGSHFAAIRLLEGYLGKEHLKLQHFGGPASRFDALMRGEVAAGVVMEPYVALAEKLGATILAEGYFLATDVARDDLSPTDLTALYRALDKAADFLNADPANKRKYLHYLVADIADGYPWGKPESEHFHLPRLRFGHTLPYPQNEFQRTLDILVDYNLLTPDATFDRVVDNRALATAL